MANGGYNPFQASQALTRLQGQVGGAGLRWQGLQKGTSRETIRKWVEEQAKKASDAASGLSQAGLFAKGVGTLAMMHPKVRAMSNLFQFLTGATVTGLTQKALGDRAVSGLSKEDMPDGLYDVDAAREAETTAHSAVDELLRAVNPAAVSSAITTPLSVMSMRTLGDNPYLTGQAGADFVESNIRARTEPSQAYSELISRFKPTTSDNPLFNPSSWSNLFEIYKRGF